MPMIVIWAGAIGGIAKAFLGLTVHWRQMATRTDGGKNAWHAVTEDRRKWNAWYLTRWVEGSLLGTAATLIVVLVLRTVGVVAQNGTAPSTPAQIDLSGQGIAVLALVSFAIGYQQAAFRKLLERFLNVVVGPGDAEAKDGPDGASSDPDDQQPTGTRPTASQQQ